MKNFIRKFNNVYVVVLYFTKFIKIILKSETLCVLYRYASNCPYIIALAPAKKSKENYCQDNK